MEKRTTGNIIDESKDHLERRCPRLGGPVSFRYCRLFAGDNLPCWKVFECWWEYFDVFTFFKENLSEENYNGLLNKKPKPKLLSLVELIEQAKKNVAATKAN